MEGPHMLSGSAIKEFIQDLLRERNDSRKKMSGTDRQVNLLLIGIFQLAAELDEIRFTLRKFAPKDTDAESTR